MFYSFRQNNSGGDFVIDSDVDLHVIVEAEDNGAACDIFEQHSGYFDGVDKGLDCNCCGDRWSRYTDDYEKLNIETAAESRRDFTDKTPHPRLTNDCIVYLADGRTLFGNEGLLTELDRVLDEIMDDI